MLKGEDVCVQKMHPCTPLLMCVKLFNCSSTMISADGRIRATPTVLTSRRALQKQVAPFVHLFTNIEATKAQVPLFIRWLNLSSPWLCQEYLHFSEGLGLKGILWISNTNSLIFGFSCDNKSFNGICDLLLGALLNSYLTSYSCLIVCLIFYALAFICEMLLKDCRYQDSSIWKT
jgi:hypothetical protein